MNTDKIFAEAIANEYSTKDTSKVVALKKLDAKAKVPSMIFTYTFGIVFALVFGVGLCLAMQVIGNGTTLMMGIGIAVGIVGIIGMAINYPIYKKMLDSSKKKYASDIIRLAKEISEEEN